MTTRQFLKIEIDGTTSRLTVDSDTSLLHPFYEAIGRGCDTVEMVALADDLEMWLDEERMYHQGDDEDKPPVNRVATRLVLYFFGSIRQNYYGTVILTGGADDEGETLGLTDAQVGTMTTVAANFARPGVRS